jgi:DNA-binding NarL/FixJ family response regulator
MRTEKLAMIDHWKSSLTPREHQVALLVGRGLSNKEVARELGLSDGTVKLHMHKILEKLGVRNRNDLILQCNISEEALALGARGFSSPAD